VVYLLIEKMKTQLETLDDIGYPYNRTPKIVTNRQNKKDIFVNCFQLANYEWSITIQQIMP
jgi:hypothetical protein